MISRIFRPILTLFLAISLAGIATAASPYLELQVELDPASRQLRARAEIVPAARDFRFQLHDSLRITAASAGGKALQVAPAGRDGLFRNWKVSLPAGIDRLTLEYGGTLPALDAKLDHRDVLQGLPPMAAAEGSFLPSNGAWYPRPAALFPYRVTITVPGDQRALVPGRLESEELPADGGGRYRASFQFTQPVDGIDLMAGPWLVREKQVPRPDASPLRLRTYFTPELDAMAGLADGYLEDTARYIELYSRQIGPYPFTEFSVVASPLPTGFGMPTLTYLGSQVLKLPFIRATSLGHEVLHNWWGNGVYVDYATGNWCEGLTTFMADYAYKERESAAAAREMRLGWLRDFAAVPSSEHSSLVSFRSRTHGAAAAVGYGKSAMVFLMLRDQIGEEAFQGGIRSFWEKNRFRVASWKDLQAAFEEASGRSLAVFFQQWLERAGGPTVRIPKTEAKPQGNKTQLTLQLEQSTPAYALRLPLEIAYDGRSEVRWIDAKGPSEQISLELDSQPDALRLDPDLRVWRVLDQEQLPPILRQWVIAKSPRLALAARDGAAGEAAQALAKRLFENPPQTISLEELKAIGDGSPVLVAGLHAEVDKALAQADLPPRPVSLGTRGSAQVWTVPRETGSPLAVISARDTEALKALLRPLPHYGSQSWLVFEGSRAIEKGVWPAPGRLIPVRRQP